MVDKSNKNNTQRSITADILKTFAIFGVAYIHSSSLVPLTKSYAYLIEPAMRFCVPAFIMLWAYFMEKSLTHKNGGAYYLWVRFYKLFIPFFFWSAIYFLLKGDLGVVDITKVISMYWTGYGWSGQYYFIILFQLIPLFLSIRQLSIVFLNRITLFLILSILFYSLVSYSVLFSFTLIEKLGHRVFIYWIPYVLIGVLFAKGVRLTKLQVPIWSALLLLPLITIEGQLGDFYNAGAKPYLLPSVFIVSTILLSTFLSRKIDSSNLGSKALNSLNTVATNTLGIFCINPLVILVLKPQFAAIEPIDFLGAGLFIPIISTLIVIVISLIIIYILKAIKLDKVV